MSFELPALKYNTDSLEPHIDTRTMEIHHGKHHAGYTNNLNNAIKGTDLESSSIENILTDKTSKLTCVDPWNGNVAHEAFDFSDVEAAFDQQLEPFKDQLIKQKAYSDEWLMKNRSKQYDFIYIDGDHMPQAFMSDAILSWELLKPGGIMAIDDYEWQHPRGAKYNPKEAINLFISMYSEHIEVIEKGWQIWIRKNIDYVRPEHIHE